MPRLPQYMMPIGKPASWLSRVMIWYSPSSVKNAGHSLQLPVVDRLGVVAEQILDRVAHRQKPINSR